MEVAEEDDRLVVRLDPGEEVIGSLETLREEHGIENGFFFGIGAVDRATLGHYDVEEQDYLEETFEGEFEVTNFSGNIGPDKVHAHITLGKRDFTTVGGHCSSARVSGTFEIVVFRGDTPLDHVKDPETGLDVFDI
ncbi:MAG: PPC domain-containing DNA-binding protein [Candidatus Nanohaloarchaea archaeon]|nr:PPC domain-containing DNA-binding protein [Candidatus Nanohaloarchaea archaeon]